MSFKTPPQPAVLPQRAGAEFVLLGSIWGASFLFTRFSVPDFGAFATAGLRVAIAALFLLPLLHLTLGVEGWRSLRTHWRQLLWVGAFNSALPFVAYAFAVQHISTGFASILNATVPLFAALVAWLWLKQAMTRWQILGVVLGFAGVALLSSASVSFPKGAQQTAGPGLAGLPLAVWALILCLCATACYAYAGNYLAKRLTAVPSMVVAAGSMLSACAVLLLPTLWGLHTLPATPSARGWGALAVLGVVCTGFAYWLYFRAIAHFGPARGMTVTYLIPVFAVFYGAVFLAEPITWRMLVGAAVVMLGTALVNKILPRKTAKPS